MSAPVQVVTHANRVPDEPYNHYAGFRESLLRFDTEPVVLGMGQGWRGLMEKPFHLRQWLRAGLAGSDRLIVSDSFDVVFVKSPLWVDGTCRDWFGPDAVVFNGAKWAWPREDLRDAYPDDGSPWRFLNSGFMCGPVDAIVALVEAMDIESVGFSLLAGTQADDQGQYQSLFARNPQPAPMVVDTQCRVAQTFYGGTVDEFDFSGEYMRNRVTGSDPGVLHLDGASKDPALYPWWPIVQAKWGLPQ